MNKIGAIIVAAGRGVRAGPGLPKQYRPVHGVAAVRHCLALFCGHGGISVVQPVIHADDRDLFTEAADGLAVAGPVSGGATRQQSVLAGLEALRAAEPEAVLVHDAARPFATTALLDRAIDAAKNYVAAVPAIAIADTVKEVDASGRVIATRDRNHLRLIQTPQVFRFAPLLAAHRAAAAAGRHDFSDDAALMEWAGHDVHIFDGDPQNNKMTTETDMRRLASDRAAEIPDIRVGSGVDVHAFAPGDHVTLGGVTIPHRQALSGHSDADVILHAIVDAVLGALADGDIGVHFPPSDPQWRGAKSSVFVAFAMKRLHARNGAISHIDVNIVCEEPRIGPHRDAMRSNIAQLTGVDPSRVGIKATTSEKLGFTGRGEGIAAFATVTIRLPSASQGTAS